MNYGFLVSLEERGIYFVTRLKSNAVFAVEAEVSAHNGQILAGEMINLPGSGKFIPRE